MKLSLVLQAVDRWSAPTKAAAASTQRMANSVKLLTDRAAPASRAMTRVDSSAARLPTVLNRASAAAMRFGRVSMTAVEIGASKASRAIDSVAAKAAGFAIRGAGAVAAGGIAAGGLLARGVIADGMAFEGYSVQLETALHSATAAKNAMAFIQKFAQETPYEIGEVTSAFITAKNQGIDPFTGAMTDIGDKASAMGKTMEDVTLAVGDAMRGQWERLIDLGITGSTKGKNVALTYFDKTGKQVTKSVAKDATTIRQLLLGIFRETSGGGMERQSKTLSGILANLRDYMTKFDLMVGDKGVYARIKSRAQSLLNWVQGLEKNGRLDKWASETSAWLTEIFDKADRFVHEVDWRAVTVGVGSITGGLIQLVEYLGKAVALWGKFNAFGNRIDKATGFGNGFNNSFEGKAWSVLSWDPFDAWRSKAAAPSKSPPPARREPVRRAGASRAEWNRALQLSPPKQLERYGAASKPQRDGKVSVDIKLSGDGAQKARVTRMSASTGVTANVINRGAAMSGAA